MKVSIDAIQELYKKLVTDREKGKLIPELQEFTYDETVGHL
jgi:hypothetical protein